MFIFDDTLKIFFNARNIPAEITVDLVDELGETDGVVGCSTLSKTAPPENAPYGVRFLLLRIQEGN